MEGPLKHLFHQKLEDREARDPPSYSKEDSTTHDQSRRNTRSPIHGNHRKQPTTEDQVPKVENRPAFVPRTNNMRIGALIITGYEDVDRM